MTAKLNTLKENIERFEHSRKFWLRISLLVVVVVNGIIWGWDKVHESRWAWILTSLGLTIGVVWWYWTMKLIRITLNHRYDEIEILKDLVSDIKSIKNDLQKSKK